MVVLFQGTCFRFHISCLGCRCVLLMIFFLLCHISHVLCSTSREVKASKAMTESINPPIHSPCWMPTGRDHGDHDSSKSGCLERFYKIWSMFNLRRSTSIVVLSQSILFGCHRLWNRRAQVESPTFGALGCTSCSTSSSGGGFSAPPRDGRTKDGHETEARAQCASVFWVGRRWVKNPIKN